MEVIRESVFETNSSSSHSFTVKLSKTKKYSWGTIIPDKNGTITFKGGDFSSGEFYESETIDKANCLAVYICFTQNKKSAELFEKVIKEQTGAKEIKYDIRITGENMNSWMSSAVMDMLESPGNYNDDFYEDEEDDDEDDEEFNDGMHDHDIDPEPVVEEDNITTNENLMKRFIFGQGAYLEAQYGWDG